MAEIEKQKIEYKSIQKIRTGDKGFKDLSVTCVAFANAQGGTIYIGFDDKKCAPPANQYIEDSEVNDTVTRLRSLCFNVALSSTEIKEKEDGGQYFEIKISPSVQSIATTSDGKIYLRIVDKCEPIRSEDVQRLMEEKGTFQWELVKTKWRSNDDGVSENLKKLAQSIRASQRAKEHIKQMDDTEIAELYHLIDSGILTNLGVLWLGNAKQRSSICYPITVQYIVYDALEKKVRKEEWHDNTKNPMELLLDVEQKAVELTYSYEFPDGLFRKQIRHYHPKLLRELLVNAFAHKSFSISNDIIIKVFTDRLEISNPGGLPLGITKDNILHAKYRRNPNMIELLCVLGLMEGEGSGYDLIYELNAMEAKNQPIVESRYGEVRVTQEAAIIDSEILPLLDYILQNYPLSQKNYIAFGIIARKQKVLTTELSRDLQLAEEDRLRSYVSDLLKQKLIQKRGVKKGTQFFVNPALIRNAKANIKTSLKTLEPHVLKALIIEDLKRHPNSKLSEIKTRLGDVDIRDVRKIVYEAVAKREFLPQGSKTNRTYLLAM